MKLFYQFSFKYFPTHTAQVISNVQWVKWLSLLNKWLLQPYLFGRNSKHT